MDEPSLQLEMYKIQVDRSRHYESQRVAVSNLLVVVSSALIAFILFAIPRTAGWLAQWLEMLEDGDQRIARPRQVYIGYDERDYAAIDTRV